MTADLVEMLRFQLSHLNVRADVQVRPDADGGAAVSASVESPDPVRAMVEAVRAVATTGAKPGHVSMRLPADSDDHNIRRAADALGVSLEVLITNDGAPSTLATGSIDELDRCTPLALSDDGDLVYWIGADDQADLTIARKVNEIMVAASRDGLLNAALDVSAGGMATTVVSMAILGSKGLRFWVPENLDVEQALFDARLGGVICIVPRTEELRFSDMCIARYIPSYRIGVVDGDEIELQGHFSIPVAALG